MTMDSIVKNDYDYAIVTSNSTSDCGPMNLSNYRSHFNYYSKDSFLEIMDIVAMDVDLVCTSAIVIPEFTHN